MNISYKGKTVFVAGGTSGINLCIATRFAEAGANVFVTSRDAQKVADAVAGLSALSCAAGVASDVRDFAAVSAAIDTCAKEFGPIDCVVSGAAGNFVAPVEAMSANGFRTVVDIDLNGTFNVYRAALDHLRAPGASLIAISATQSLLPGKGQAHVCAAKAGVNMLTQTLALELGSKGIRANAIVPGPIGDTEGMKRLTPTQASADALASSIPLARFGAKSEVADLALYLASDHASYITGAIIPCDGGQSLTGHGTLG